MPEILLNHDVKKDNFALFVENKFGLYGSMSGHTLCRERFPMYGLFCPASVPLLTGHPVEADSVLDILVIIMSLLFKVSKLTTFKS